MERPLRESGTLKSQSEREGGGRRHKDRRKRTEREIERQKRRGWRG